jgi:hypothetical protein
MESVKFNGGTVTHIYKRYEMCMTKSKVGQRTINVILNSEQVDFKNLSDSILMCTLPVKKSMPLIKNETHKRIIMDEAHIFISKPSKPVYPVMDSKRFQFKKDND